MKLNQIKIIMKYNNKKYNKKCKTIYHQILKKCLIVLNKK